MSKRKKRVFHCSKCGNPTETYKKGRKHRVIICPRCGIIASNPLPLLALAASALPSVIEGASSFLSDKKSSTPKDTARLPITKYDNLDKPNKGERYVKMALGE